MEAEDELSIGFAPMEQTIEPTFGLKEIDIKSYTKSPIQTISMTEKCILIATSTNQIIRKRLDIEDEYKLFEMPCRPEVQIVKIYNDVHGFHFIIACTQNEYYYMNLEEEKISLLKGLGKYQITALYFSLGASISSSNNILFGTFDGFICFYSLELSQKIGVIETPVKKLFQLPHNTAIYGLAFDYFEYKPTENSKTIQALILVATNEALYQLLGELPFSRLFEKYSSTGNLNQYMKMIPKGNMSQTQLITCYQYRNGEFESHSFVWKTGAGVVYGTFRDRNEITKNIVIKDMVFESYRSKDNTIEIPESISISDNYIYLVYQDELSIMSKISKRVIHSEELKKIDTIKCVIYEVSTRSLWLSTSRKIFRLSSQNAELNLWRQHIECGNYKEALKCCRDYNPKWYGRVTGLYGNELMKNRKYADAAIQYADSNFRVENVILKFLKANAHEQLSIYLTKLLERIKYNPKKKTQRVLLCTYLAELQLGKLVKLQAATESTLPENVTELKMIQRQMATELYNKAVEEFRVFMEEYEADLEIDVIFQLLQSHGRIEECLILASLKKCYEVMLVHYINNGDYHTAIQTLNDVPNRNLKNTLMVKYISIFMKHEAEFTINSLHKYYEGINPDAIITSIISVEGKDKLLADNYVKTIMVNSNNKFLANLHLFFLVESNTPEAIEELNNFLEQQRVLHHKNQPTEIDKDFALDVCKRAGLVEAQIKIYSMLNFYDECVRLSLETRKYKEAKEYADLPSDKRTRKKLWIEIAKVIIKENEDNVKASFDIMNESGMLTLSDILQFLSPKMKLSVFKKELMNSLQSYGKDINELKQKISVYTKNAEELTTRLNDLQNSCVPVSANQYCDKCKKTLLGEERFYVFPCLHSFHRWCLLDWMLEYKIYIPKYKLRRLETISEFMRGVGYMPKKDGTVIESDSSSDLIEPKGFLNTLGNFFTKQKMKEVEEQKEQKLSKEEQEILKRYESQLEILLTEDCILCGHFFMDSIDLPFDSSQEFSWTI